MKSELLNQMKNLQWLQSKSISESKHIFASKVALSMDAESQINGTELNRTKQ